MNECIFCKIMNGSIPSYTIYEDEIVKVFLDINPNCKVTIKNIFLTKENTEEVDGVKYYIYRQN